MLVRYWPIIIIIAITTIFFAKLFFPPSIFVTPDFGRTDILHIELAQKYVLATHLKQFSIPFWETDVGRGYPIFAELLGATNIINILTLFILPFELAIPTIYLLTFLSAAFGTYLLLIWLKLDKTSALFGSIGFTFSAAMILSIPHLNVSQAVSLVPFAFFFFLKFLKEKSVKNWAITTFILSQILSSFAQIFVYAAILMIIFGFFNFWKNPSNIYKFLLLTSSILAFAILLNSVTLLSSYEMFKHSERTDRVNPETILTNFPLLPQNLLAFINPFILGKAQDGTYNSLEWTKKGIYWENTAYIGLVPLIFAVWAILLQVKSRDPVFRNLAILVVIAILLSLGKHSPLHITFSFPPLSYFRVPSRFLIFAQLFLALLAARGLNHLSKNLPVKIYQGLALLIVALTFFDLFSKWWNYHPIGKTNDWLSIPQTGQIIKNDNPNRSRILSIGSVKNWNDVFTKHGWKNQLTNYKFFMNSLEPNTNLYHDLANFSSYQLLPTRRQSLQQSIVQKNISVSNSIEIGDPAKKILEQNAVKYLISTIPIETNDYQKLSQVEKDNFKYFVYANGSASKIASVYYDYHLVTSIGDYWKAYESVDTQKTVILEKELIHKFEKGTASIQTLESQDNHLKLDVITNKDGILVVSNSYYPGWKAQVSGNPTEIYPANINSQAIIIPKGENIVEFYYRPTYFQIGLAISTISYGFLIVLILKSSKFFNRFIDLLFTLLIRPFKK